MTDWIKYDGTNKPDDDAMVRVRFPDGWESGPDDWEMVDYWDWSVTGVFLPKDEIISHFQLKGKENG